ncbi:hypothetical protein QR680_016062 [Steinernema hermaphroditum]|uniref:Metalloendopeptidase n=1 Tax=Steinernema hermaphroditum TaxID=289476 RepID=A0AA39H9X2_9BILA|nr:hypothetical protein QR680_016062 [Steinernema hermaphroditum]
MRILPILFVLFAAASPFSLVLEQAKPLRGKEFLKRVLPGYADIDEVAELIATHKLKKKQQFSFQQHKELSKAAREVMKLNAKPLPADAPKTIAEINTALGLEEVLIGADIMMTAEQARSYLQISERKGRSKRQAYQPEYFFPKSLWTNPIPYYHDPYLSDNAREKVEWAINFWEQNTCVRFQRINDPNRSPSYPYLKFFNGGGCYSQIGRIESWQEQPISIGSGGCEFFGTTCHEIAHALGFMHEQMRWDRDQYIYVDLNAVEVNKTKNYDPFPESENDNYGKQYDFRSIMHYDDNAFAKDDETTVMYARNPAYQMTIGRDPVPHYGDIFEMNMLYKCYDKCANSRTVCQNEGRPNPNNCAVCQCPGGFAGRDCSEREAPSAGLNCGETLQASDSWKPLTSKGVVGRGSYNSENTSDPAHCTWHIKAPAGKRIQYYVTEVRIAEEEDFLCTKKCYFGGLSIKGFEPTLIPEGMRFCCSAQLNKVFATASNILIVQPYSNIRYTDFTVMYRIADGSVPPLATTKSTVKPSTKATTPQTPATSPTYKIYGYKNFLIATLPVPFHEAEQYCEQFNARLISFHDKATENDLIDMFGRLLPNLQKIFWVGLNKPQGVRSTYSWIDGSRMDYSNWFSGFPKATVSEECGLFSSSKWAGSDCKIKHPFVCRKN